MFGVRATSLGNIALQSMTDTGATQKQTPTGVNALTVKNKRKNYTTTMTQLKVSLD